MKGKIHVVDQDMLEIYPYRYASVINSFQHLASIRRRDLRVGSIEQPRCTGFVVTSRLIVLPAYCIYEYEVKNKLSYLQAIINFEVYKITRSETNNLYKSEDKYSKYSDISVALVSCFENLLRVSSEND